jgi:hypothetical protein
MTANVREAGACADPETDDEDRGARTIAGEPLKRLLLVALGLLGLATALVVLTVVRGQQISPVDEATHADYAYQISHGSIPASGALINREILQEWSCHTMAGTTLPPCGAANPAPSLYPHGGQDYNFGHPPLYYLVTGFLDRGINGLVHGTGTFITIGRFLGLGWLYAGMITLYFALRRFLVPWRFAALGAALLPLCPGVLAASTTMTNDAAAALCGAAGLWVLARLTVQRRIGWVAPAVVTVLTTGTKVLNGLPMLAVIAVAAVLAFAAWRRGEKARARALALAALAGAAAFCAVYLGWLLYQAGRGVAHWVNPNAPPHLSGSQLGDLLSTWFSGFQHLVIDYYLPQQVNGETIMLWAMLLTMILVAAPLLVMAVSRGRSAAWILGLATLLGIVCYPPIVEFQVYMANKGYFPIVTGRYGMTFIPWAIACLAIVAGRRRLLRLSTATVGLGSVVMVLGLLGVFNLGPAR